MRKFLFCAAIMCFAAPAAFADHEPGHPAITITKGSWLLPTDTDLFDTVQNPQDGSLTAPSVNKAKQDIARTPGSVDLIPAEAFNNKYTQTMKDVLQNTPGVIAQPRYGEESRLSIRGSGIGRSTHLRGIEILQDGVPINLADGGGDYQEIDPLISRYVEVYKGGNGLQYGAASLGGVINFVTPTGYSAPFENFLRVDGGSFNTLRTHGSLARTGGPYDIYTAVTGISSDGYRDHSAQLTGRVSTNLGYRFNDNAETRFYLTYNNINQEVPGTLTLNQALNTPHMSPTANKLNDYQRDIRSLRLANKTSFLTDDGFKLDVGTFVLSKDLFHPITIVLDQKTTNAGAFARGTGSYKIGDYRNTFTVGSNIRGGETDALTFTNVGGSRGVKTGDADQESGSYDIFAENQFFVTPEVALVTGLQGLYATRDYANHLNAAASDDKDYAALSPKLGVIWDVTGSQQVFANVSRSYEPPTFSELVQTGVSGFVPLDAQRAWTTEIGTRGQTADHRFAYDATLFRSWVKGELLNFTVTPDVPASVFNAGNTIHQGVELGFDVDIGRDLLLPADSSDKILLRQVYTYSDFTFDGDKQYGDNRIAGIPEHMYRAELRYAHHDGWHITPNMEWVPKGGFVDYANNLRAPGYTIYGVQSGYDLTKDTHLFLEARNLFDKRYISNFSTITNATTAATNVFYPGDGFSVFGGVSVGF